MLTVGEPIPDAKVWLAPREPVSLRELVAERPALFLSLRLVFDLNERDGAPA